MFEIIKTAFVYSCIAFSIVFVVLGGLTVVIYAMRLITGSNAPSAPGTGAGGGTPAPVPAAAPAPASSGGKAAPIAAVNVKAQHVAAITAAILAATQGRGRVLGIAPALASAQGQACPSLAAARWHSTAIVKGIGRGLSPSWKR
jgi:Na+-transporting methylmalonyl-CoA/oxaloacetate decarboxylase gamma subunit